MFAAALCCRCLLIYLFCVLLLLLLLPLLLRLLRLPSEFVLYFGVVSFGSALRSVFAARLLSSRTGPLALSSSLLVLMVSSFLRYPLLSFRAGFASVSLQSGLPV